MNEFMGHKSNLGSASLAQLAQYKMGGIITSERMARALRWAQVRQELDRVVDPVREYVEYAQEAPAHKVRVVGKFLACAIIHPEGFRRGHLEVPDSDRSVSSHLTVAIQRAKRAGIIDIVEHAPSAPARAVATAALLLTALDEPRTAWLPEQVRVVDESFDLEQLWARLDPAKVDDYRSAVDRSPLP